MQSILGNTRKTDITFRADGRIDIAARVASLLSLHKGDVIDVLDGGGELYLYVKLHAPTVGRHEAACFPTHARSRHFRAWSKRLCRAMICKSGSGKGRVALSVGSPARLPGMPVALPIIYGNILGHDTRG